MNSPCDDLDELIEFELGADGTLLVDSGGGGDDSNSNGNAECYIGDVDGNSHCSSANYDVHQHHNDFQEPQYFIIQDCDADELLDGQEVHFVKEEEDDNEDADAELFGSGEHYVEVIEHLDDSMVHGEFSNGDIVYSNEQLQMDSFKMEPTSENEYVDEDEMDVVQTFFDDDDTHILEEHILEQPKFNLKRNPKLSSILQHQQQQQQVNGNCSNTYTNFIKKEPSLPSPVQQSPMPNKRTLLTAENQIKTQLQQQHQQTQPQQLQSSQSTAQKVMQPITTKVVSSTPLMNYMRQEGSTTKKKTLEEHTGPMRYMLFDELIATIVDFDIDDTPIVEFSSSRSKADLHLPVECGICPEIMHRSKLAIHIKTHLVPETNRYGCIYCKESYRDSKYLAGHARRHMGIRPYVCDECKLYFSTRQDQRVHNQRRHIEKQHTCEICGKNFAQNTQLKRHRESMHEKKRRFSCPQCPKAYYKNFSLQEHIRNVHMGKRRMLKCPFCDMQCRDAHKMARHRRDMHLKQGIFECHDCREEFTDINYFDAHKRSIQCRSNARLRLLQEEENKAQQINLLRNDNDGELVDENYMENVVVDGDIEDDDVDDAAGMMAGNNDHVHELDADVGVKYVDVYLENGLEDDQEVIIDEEQEDHEALIEAINCDELIYEAQDDI